MAKMGRPKKYGENVTKISVSLDPKVMHAINEHAANENRPISVVINTALSDLWGLDESQQAPTSSMKALINPCPWAAWVSGKHCAELQGDLDDHVCQVRCECGAQSPIAATPHDAIVLWNAMSLQAQADILEVAE